MSRADSNNTGSPLGPGIPYVPNPTTQHQLDAANSQLSRYAVDLKTMLRREAKRTKQVIRVNQQLKAYAHDLKKSYDAEQRKNQELEQAYAETIVRLSLASRYKDEETGGHIERLSHYSKKMALCIGWAEEPACQLFAAAPMHDVGKIGIPDAILGKNGPLEEEEWEMVKQHPALGASLLMGSSSPLLKMAREVALTHHERWDGSGYPHGLKEDQIPLTGRIVMLADHYDALRSQRPYKPSFSHKKTCDLMLTGNDRTKPSHFDPQLLAAFREIHGEFDLIYSRVIEETHGLDVL